MNFKNLLYIILISFSGLMSCNSSPAPEEIQKGVHISLSADSSTVELHDVEPDVLAYLQKESLSNKEWQSLFAVYPDTNDPELRDLQFPLDGNYVIRDSFIVFLPNEAFNKDSAYFARFYRSQILMKPSDVIKEGNLSRRAEVVEFNFRR